MPVADLVDAPRNVKDHADDLIAGSIGRFGMMEAPLLDERTGRIVGGHGRRDELLRREAAGEAPPDGIIVGPDGRWQTPVQRGWASASDEEADAAAIALNRIGEVGGWKPDLEAVLASLVVSPLGLDGLGFSPPDLDNLPALMGWDKLGMPAKVEFEGDPDAVPEPPKKPVTKPWDLWVLGDHQLLCGDCRDPNDVAKVLGGRRVNVAFTSPPYASQRDYDESSGFLPIVPSEYVEWFAPVAANVAAHLAEDGSWFVNIKPPADDLDTDLYVLDLVTAHARAWGWHFATEFCWERNGIPGLPRGRFQNAFEPHIPIRT